MRHDLQAFIPSVSASIGSRRAARIAGYRPKNRPTSAVMPMPSATDHALDRRRNRRERRDRDRDGRAEHRADDAAEDRQHDRLGEHLRHDVGPPRAERLAQADLARPLGDHHQHDVHDHDAADDERQRDDADQHGEDAVGRRVVDVEDRVRREHAEVVRLLRLQPPRDAQRDRRLVHRLRRSARRSRGLTRQRQRAPRAEHHLELPERDDRELVLRLAEQRAALGADADDAEVDAFDLDDLVERIDVGAEQPVGGLPADHRRPAAPCRPRSGSSAGRARRRSSRS